MNSGVVSVRGTQLYAGQPLEKVQNDHTATKKCAKLLLSVFIYISVFIFFYSFFFILTHLSVNESPAVTDVIYLVLLTLHLHLDDRSSVFHDLTHTWVLDT